MSAEELGAKIAEEMKKEENCHCADCGKVHPKWVSTNLGVFLCLQCSSVHRSLGTDFSQVRSIGLDTLTIGQAKRILSIGNKKANEYWESSIPKDFRRPKWSTGNGSEITNFIKQKYVQKKWALKGDYNDFISGKKVTEKPKEEIQEVRELPTFDLIEI